MSALPPRPGRLAVHQPLLILCAVVIAVGGAAEFASAGTQRVVTDALIKMTVVVGMYIFVGNSGILSFGHVSFMAVGAYVAAWLTIPPETKAFLLPELPAVLAEAHWPPIMAALAAAAAAAGFALVIGVPLMRLNGISASIATFAVLAVVGAVLSNWTSMTGGQGSLYGLPPHTDKNVALLWALAAIAAAWVYQQSARGLCLRASREDAVAARASAVNVRRERLVAFVIGAFFVGAAGAMYAHFLGVVVAKEFYLRLTFITIAMLVIGGIGSLTGAVVGVLAVSFVGEVLRYAERGFELGPIAVPARPGLQEVALAAILLLILIFRPRGLSGGREITLYTGRGGAKAKSTPPTTAAGAKSSAKGENG